MLIRRFYLAAFLVLTALAGPALAVDFPKAECRFSDDNSRMDVFASNSTSTRYACVINCRLNVANQRAFDQFQCQFNLGANTSEKIVCTHKGSGPGHFTKMGPPNYTCSPR